MLLRLTQYGYIGRWIHFEENGLNFCYSRAMATGTFQSNRIVSLLMAHLTNFYPMQHHK